MTVTVSGESEADWDGHFGVKGVLFGVSVVIRRLGVNKEPGLMMCTWMSKLLRLIDGSEERVESKSMLPFKYSTPLLIQAQITRLSHCFRTSDEWMIR